MFPVITIPLFTIGAATVGSEIVGVRGILVGPIGIHIPYPIVSPCIRFLERLPQLPVSNHFWFFDNMVKRCFQRSSLFAACRYIVSLGHLGGKRPGYKQQDYN